MKKITMPQRMPPASASSQRGVALFVVIIFVMLSMLLALWASRTSLFNELVVGNDADYQRAFEAAQALMLDAELDVRGENADGTSCASANCRNSMSSVEKIPLEAKDIGPLLVVLTGKATGCSNALCAKTSDRKDFWNDKTTLAALAQDGVGARYGQYTGADKGSTSKPSNPILSDTSAANSGGWYWIEVLPYDESSKNSGLIVGGSSNRLPLNLTPSVVYRITAIAYGRKANTMVVLQQTYARQRLKD